MKKWMLVLALAGCGPVDSAQRVKNAVAALPSCSGDAEVGSVRAIYACDLIQCDTPCCNTCSLSSAELTTSSGSMTMERGRARDVLGLVDSATSCEATDANRAFDGVRMRFVPDACVKR